MAPEDDEHGRPGPCSADDPAPRDTAPAHSGDDAGRTAGGQDERTTAVGRAAAAAEAGHRGDVAALRAAQQDPDPTVRSAVLGGLRRAGALGPADLVAAVADAHPGVRRRAAQEVAALTGGELTTSSLDGITLLGLLDDEDPTVVEVAAWASGERVPPEEGAVARLAALATTHSDALVREAAVAALGAIGDPAALGAVLAGTRDKATVRRRAVLALAPFDGPEIDAALEAAAADRDWQVRQAAEDLRR